MINFDLMSTANVSKEDLEYSLAVEQYVKMFGYKPYFVCLPDPTIEQILNAVKTGVELYIEESSQTEYEI